MTKDSDTLTLRERISIGGIRFHGWLGRKKRRLLRPGSIGIGTIALAYGVLQLLESHDVPSKDAWKVHEPLGLLLIGTGLVALEGTFLVFVGYARSLKKAEQNDELFEGCRAVWHLVVAGLGLDMRKVGVHLWSVRGFPGCRYLERRASFIIEPRRTTQVTWRRGKGAIGLAWAEDDALVANVEHLVGRATSERLFYETPRRERYGLDWREFKRARRYRSVLAVPLRALGKVRGCLSVDLQSRRAGRQARYSVEERSVERGLDGV